MNTAPKTQLFAPWKTLRQSLPGSFTVRARGLLGNDFVLLGADGAEHGYLKMTEGREAKFTVGGMEILMDHKTGSRYTMLSDGEEILYASPSNISSDELEVWCGEESYKASVSLFRNRTVVRGETGDETVRLAGNPTGRSYKVELDLDDPCALPVAMLLIYHTALSRRRAYLTAR